MWELYLNKSKQNSNEQYEHEMTGVPLEEFVGLRPKVYNFVYKEKEIKTAIGITLACKGRNWHESYIFEQQKII